MLEETVEAKEEVVEAPETPSFDEVADKVFDAHEEKDTPAESSPETKPPEEEAKDPKAEGTDLEKKGAEGEGADIPKEFHKNPAWQRIIKERNEAREALDSKSALSSEDKALMEDVRGISKSPAYIQTSMKSQGYTQEAINAKLQELGHKVPENAMDDVSLVLNKLNIDPKTITEDVRGNLTDIASVVDVIVQDRLGKFKQSEISPIHEREEKAGQSASANKMLGDMQKFVSDKGVLDYKKDIEPALNDWLDKNPEADQVEAFAQFKVLHADLSIVRLRVGGRKKERDGKKGNLRQNLGSLPQGKLPAKTGDREVDMDAFIEANPDLYKD